MKKADRSKRKFILDEQNPGFILASSKITRHIKTRDMNKTRSKKTNQWGPHTVELPDVNS